MARKRTGPTLVQRSREIPPSDKARWHNDEGAGKSHVIREFFGLSAADESAIEQEVGFAIDVNLRRTEG